MTTHIHTDTHGAHDTTADDTTHDNTSHVDATALRASILLDSLPDYVSYMWSLISSSPLEWNWHLDELCDVLSLARTGHIKRLLVNIPPGFMKSLLISVMWPSWIWAHDPSRRFLTFAYTDKNTIRDNLDVRSIITSPRYTELFPHVKLSSDQNAKEKFTTTAGGWRIASSVGGQGTGDHPDFLLIDDPSKAADAMHPETIRSTNAWYDRTIPSRVARKPVMVVIMQRLHLLDLSAHLRAKGGWTHVCFPMRYVRDDDKLPPDPRDHRTTPGELLWPSHWPEERVREEEINLGEYVASAQLQQRPVPEGGGIIKRQSLTIIDAPLAGSHVRRARGWDIAHSLNRGDYTVGVLIAYDYTTGVICVEHVVRVQDVPGEVNKLILQTALLDGTRVMIREGSMSGKPVIAARAIDLAGFDYAASPETSNTTKITRIDPFRAQCDSGNVRILRAPWNEPYVDVMSSFPFGTHDDDVDATSNAFNALVEAKPALTSALWGRDRRR